MLMGYFAYIIFGISLFLSACTPNTYPESVPSEVLEVSDGDQIELNPTIVTKIINGTAFKMYGYNGQIPGPVIKAPEGSTITVNVKNSIDMDTTIHWHGLRLDNKNDGVPNLTQDVIHPNGTYTYTVTFPDEGIYWYHPHVREDIQQDMGLYGNLLVEPTSDSAYAPANYKEILILDDLMLDRDGKNIAYGNSEPNLALMGRFGNTMLINGELAKDYSISVKRGSVVRFYLTNVANTRTFNLKIDGGAMKLVGSDVGRYEHEQWVESITIAPAERYIVDVLFEDDGHYKIMHESPRASYDMGTVIVTSDDASPSYEKDFHTLRTNKDVVIDIDSFREDFDRPIDKTLVLDIQLDEQMGMMHQGMAMHNDDDGIEWEDTMPMMNQVMASEDFQWKLIDKETGKENMDIDWNFTKGDRIKVRIENRADSAHPMQHPIHFHGQRFLVLSQNGVPNTNLAWKDTVLIPIGDTVDLLFDISNTGDWMMHCHIAEHLSNGMMGKFRVTE